MISAQKYGLSIASGWDSCITWILFLSAGSVTVQLTSFGSTSMFSDFLNTDGDNSENIQVCYYLIYLNTYT